MRVTVVGAGVNGLCSAIRLLEAGHDTNVVTRDPPAATTSTIAGAVWAPYGVTPDDRLLRWAGCTLDVLLGLAADGVTGVRRSTLFELFAGPVPDPWWATAAPSFRRGAPAELPPGYGDAWVIETAVMQSPRYVAYLAGAVRSRGGTIDVHPGGVADLSDVLASCDAVVNCSGLGAADLVPDPDVVPVRGQVVRVRNPGLERCLIDEHGPAGMTYVFPRGDDCILGGTADIGEWDRTPDPAATASILERCTRLEPALERVEVLEVLVGLRPSRPSVRLEREDGADGIVVHDYGHGGSGMSLSWGCADEVVELLSR
jgi:D-amino-acid oxidase